MTFRLFILFGVFGCALALSAATPTAASRASQALMASYPSEDPVKLAAAALALAEKGNAEGQFVIGLLQTVGAGVTIDAGAAQRWLEKSARQGHAGAALTLAWRKRTGFGDSRADPEEAARLVAAAGNVPADAYAPWLAKTDNGFEPDFNRAFFWMGDAADAGNVTAMRNLAECYLSKFWTIPSTSEHLLWIQRASDAGNLEAMLILSVYLEAGTFLPADEARARALRLRSANGGYATAQFTLGLQYDLGRSSAPDFATAAAWYTKAAKQDFVPAIIRLIEIYRAGGPGLPQDFKKARKFAEQGRALHAAAATRNLADLYHRGEGVTKDVARSIALYEEAAAGGDAPAMSMLGWIARKGLGGRVDSTTALRWYNQAADLGQIPAMLEAGEMHEKGEGVGPNPSVAFTYYERAARLGAFVAQDKVGAMLLAGRGIPQDSAEAVNWFRLAARNAPAPGLPLAPRLRAWGLDDELARGIDGLIAVAREENDPWLEDNLVAALASDPLLRPELEKKILRVLEEPDLLAVPGILPEACLAALEANPLAPKEGSPAEAWFQKLLAADRIQSALLLGRHALDGRFMPRDALRALHWAKIASANAGVRGAVLLAQAENTTAADEAERARSMATLRKFAFQGDPDAARFVATRQALAGNRDVFTNVANGFAFVLPAPTDAEIANRIAIALKVRKPGHDYPPEPLFRSAPHYPFELRRENIEGSVVVEFTINEEGRTEDFRVVRSTDLRFEPAALTAVGTWRFAPGWKQGKPVRVKASQTLEFKNDFLLLKKK